MKKLFLGIGAFALVVLSSCSKEPIEQIPQTESQPTTRGVDNQGYNSLGTSYDVTMGYYEDDATRYPAIDINAFIAANSPDVLVVSSTGGGGHKTYAGSDAADFSQTVTKGLSVTPIKLFGVSFGLSSETTRTNTYHSKYSYARVDMMKQVKSLELNATPEMLRGYLLPAFTRDLNSMTPAAFVKKYGTHILLDIHIGGKMRFDYRSEIIETSSSTSKKVIVDAGVKKAVVDGGADKAGSFQNQTSESHKNATWELSVSYMGGTRSGHSVQFDSNGNPVTSLNFDAWESSVTEANAGIIDIDWGNAHYIYEFIADATKRAQIKTATEQYIGTAGMTMIKVKPLYRLWDSWHKNTFFTTSYDEAKYYQTTHNYTFDNGRAGRETHYVQGYVFETQQPGTVPLYRLWDSGAKNTFFSNSASEAQYYISSKNHEWDYGYNTHYILGYVYPNNYSFPAECRPVYRLYNRIDKNTFMTTDETEANYYRIPSMGYSWDSGTTSHIQGYLLPFNNVP